MKLECFRNQKKDEEGNPKNTLMIQCAEKKWIVGNKDLTEDEFAELISKDAGHWSADGLTYFVGYRGNSKTIEVDSLTLAGGASTDLPVIEVVEV